MNREERLDKAEAALKRTRAKLTEWAGPCYQCHHWRSLHHRLGGSSKSKVTDYDSCVNPLVLSQKPDYVKGLLHQEVLCRDVRSPTGICGPTGELFEPVYFKEDGSQAHIGCYMAGACFMVACLLVWVLI